MTSSEPRRPRQIGRLLVRALGLLGLVVATVAAVCVVRAMTWRSRQVEASPAVDLPPIRDGAAERLTQAIRCATVSFEEDGRVPDAAFTQLRDLLRSSYPAMHESLRMESFGRHALLYTWDGSEPEARPLLFAAHQDVVPVEQGTEPDWTVDPFAGVIRDGFIWGRGALDMKSGLMAVCEAVESLRGSGFRPRRTVYFAFGDDEERGGRDGAAAIATALEQRGVRLEAVFDEGGVVTTRAMPGLSAPLALIGVGERGYADIAVIAQGPGGHASMPPPRTAAGVLGRALQRMEDRPLPARIAGPTAWLFDHVGPELAFGTRIVFANRWLFDPLLVRILGRSPTTNAIIRSTCAITMLEGSDKVNVLPTEATATCNVRLLPGDTVDDVLDHYRRVVADSDRVRFEVVAGRHSPAPWVSPIATPAYAALARAIRGELPDVVVAPGLSPVSTDSKHYVRLTDAVYRFLPCRLGPEDLSRIHGIDERIAVADHEAAIRLYTRLIRELAGSADGERSP